MIISYGTRISGAFVHYSHIFHEIMPSIKTTLTHSYASVLTVTQQHPINKAAYYLKELFISLKSAVKRLIVSFDKFSGVLVAKAEATA